MRAKKTLNFSSTLVKTEIQTKKRDNLTVLIPSEVGGVARAEETGDKMSSEDARLKAEDTAGQRLRCEGCGVQSSSTEKLERHQRLFHDSKGAKKDSNALFKCVQCSKGFSGVAKLLIHKYSHSVKLKPGGVCNLCKARFDNIKRHHLEKHI